MAEKPAIASLRKSEGRGKFLTAMLVLSVLNFLIVILPSVIREIMSPFVFKDVPTQLILNVYVGWDITTIILWPAIFIGVWYWKRITIYTLFFVFGVNLILASISRIFVYRLIDYPLFPL